MGRLWKLENFQLEHELTGQDVFVSRPLGVTSSILYASVYVGVSGEVARGLCVCGRHVVARSSYQTQH